MRRPSWKYRGLVVAGLVLGLALPTQAAGVGLVGRLAATPGGTDYQAYYDLHKNVTWAANANIANGTMNWNDANSWASGLTIGGVSGWRLPTTRQPDFNCSIQSDRRGLGTGCRASEMGHLFNEEGITAAAPGVFNDVQAGYYWSGTRVLFNVPVTWRFNFNSGRQLAFNNGKDFAWAVRSGDVPLAAVPAPSVMLLMGSGLIGLLAWRRLRRG